MLNNHKNVTANFAAVFRREEEMKQEAPRGLQFCDFYSECLESTNFLFEMDDQDDIVTDEINRFATSSPSMDELILRAHKKSSSLGQNPEDEKKRRLSGPRRALSSLFRKSSKE